MMRKWCILALSLLVAGCSGKKESPQGEGRHQLPEQIQLIQANGKVMPQNGFLSVSAEISGRVSEICVSQGERVRKGQQLIRLDGEAASQKVREADARLRQKLANVDLVKASLEKAEVEYRLADSLYRISSSLYHGGGETRRNLIEKEKQAASLRLEVAENRAKLIVAEQERAAAREELAQARSEGDKGVITAPQDGRVLDIEAELGGVVQPYGQLATFAPNEPVVVEAEVDELFAPELKLGQRADIHLIGYSQVIARGKIVQLMDYLSDKSIFSGMNAEQQDRQMRKIKILLDDQQRHPLLGTKVICDIHLKK